MICGPQGTLFTFVRIEVGITPVVAGLSCSMR